MLAYDLLSADRNLQITDPSRRITRHASTIARRRSGCSRRFPTQALTGARLVRRRPDTQPAAPRAVLRDGRRATRRPCANYVEAERLLVRDKRVYGIAARDTLERATASSPRTRVLNAAGPWADGLLKGLTPRNAIAPSNWSRDACFVINRRPYGPWALALKGVAHDGDAKLNATRAICSWRPGAIACSSACGTRSCRATPMPHALTRGELATWIDEINASHPSFDLRESRSGARRFRPRAVRRPARPRRGEPHARQAFRASSITARATALPGSSPASARNTPSRESTPSTRLRA